MISDKEELRDKILKGLELAIKRMIDRKKLLDGNLVISENGQVKIIKAKDFKG